MSEFIGSGNKSNKKNIFQTTGYIIYSILISLICIYLPVSNITIPIFTKITSIILTLTLISINCHNLNKIIIRVNSPYYIIILITSILITSGIELLTITSQIYFQKQPQNYTPDILKITYINLFFRDFIIIILPIFYKLYKIKITDNTKDKLIKEIKNQQIKIYNHFLLNVMSMLYVSTLKKENNFPQLILNVSKLIGYNCLLNDKQYINLQQEIDFIENYLTFEKLRHEHKIDLKFNVEGKPDNVEVPPMMFECFINNAFKYVADDGSGYINITIKIQTGTIGKIKFTCENNKKDKNNRNIYSTQSGLKNAIKRLDLIYGKKYKMKISDELHRYLIEVII